MLFFSTQERKAKRGQLKAARIRGGYTDEKGDFVKFKSGKDKRKYKRDIKGKSADLRSRRLQEIARQGAL